MPVARISAGELCHLVKTRTRGAARDTEGGPVATDSDSADEYAAAVKPMGGRELARAGLVVGDADVMVLMPAFEVTDALKPNDAILYGSKVFEIVSKRNVEQGDVFYEFLCKEVVT